MCTTWKKDEEKIGKREITEEIESIHFHNHSESGSGPQCQRRGVVILMDTDTHLH